MGLDCLPVNCPDELHGERSRIPDGLTHERGAPCPFQTDEFIVGPFGSCCSLRGKVAARELDALGEVSLSERMHQDMTHAEAITFAEELAAAADRLDKWNAHRTKKPKGAGYNGTWDDTAKAWVWAEYSTFAEALASIREAARWYEKVGSLGFGVHAWY